MQRRMFSREFKVEAVRLVRKRGVSAAQAARDLDVHENALRKWVFVGGLLILLFAWRAGNVLAGGHAYDLPPFPIMQDAVGVLALFLTVLS